MPEDIEVGRMPYKRGGELVFKLSEYRDQYYFAIRAMFKDQTGVWRFTKEGIHLNTINFKQFKENIDKLIVEIEKRGLFDKASGNKQ